MAESQREQTRRELAAFNSYGRPGSSLSKVLSIAHSLLAELEQAERQRDEERHAKNSAMVLANKGFADFEARLAKVPALVEALRRIEDEHTARDGEVSVRDSAAIVARDALAAWEQE